MTALDLLKLECGELKKALAERAPMPVIAALAFRVGAARRHLEEEIRDARK